MLSAPSLAQDLPNVNCKDPQTQMEFTYCAEQDWQAADAELNKAYKAAMAQMKSYDEGLAEYAKELVGAANALKEAQRAWIPYRDKACEAFGFQARGGSMEPQLIYDCNARMTRIRTDELKALAKGLGN
nr:lysozyme inhibitor LprI family protein [Roseibium suaedae]